MSARPGKSLLIVVRHTPYGSSLGRAALDAALAAAAFDQPVNILFMGDGVLHLQANQDSRAIGLKNIGSLLSSLPLYDVETVFADAETAQLSGVELDAAPVAVQPLDGPGIRRLMIDSDHLLGF